MTFGELMRSERLLCNLSLRAVENATGISNSFIYQVENGSEVSLSNAVKLAKFYGIPAQTFLEAIGYT